MNLPSVCLPPLVAQAVMLYTPKVHPTNPPSFPSSPLLSPQTLLLLLPSAGVSVFGAFLRSEFSEENLQFFLACEQYENSSNNFSLQRRARDICATYIQPGAPREVQLFPSSLCVSIYLLACLFLIIFFILSIKSQFRSVFEYTDFLVFCLAASIWVFFFFFVVFRDFVHSVSILCGCPLGEPGQQDQRADHAAAAGSVSHLPVSRKEAHLFPAGHRLLPPLPPVQHLPRLAQRGRLEATEFELKI